MPLGVIVKSGIVDRVTMSSSSNIRCTAWLCFEFIVELLASTLKGSLGLGFTLCVLMVPAGHAIFRYI
jgi:hypothetical protein